MSAYDSSTIGSFVQWTAFRIVSSNELPDDGESWPRYLVGVGSASIVSDSRDEAAALSIANRNTTLPLNPQVFFTFFCLWGLVLLFFQCCFCRCKAPCTTMPGLKVK